MSWGSLPKKQLVAPPGSVYSPPPPGECGLPKSHLPQKFHKKRAGFSKLSERPQGIGSALMAQRGARRSDVKINWVLVNRAFPDFSGLSGSAQPRWDNHDKLTRILNVFKEKDTLFSTNTGIS